jgi:hypothetical protein
MSRRALAAFLAVLASLSFLALAPGSARGQEPATGAAPKVMEPKEAVSSVMRALGANKGTLRIGMTVAAADRACAGAANHVDERILPLEGSFLDKERRLRGALSWDPDLEKGTKVGLIQAVLLTDRFDRKELGRTIVAVGKELGFNLATDKEAPYTWFDAEAEGVELWVTLGDGVVVIESQVLVE